MAMTTPTLKTENDKMNEGQTVRVLDAANLPCQAGDIGVIVAVRQSARDFPIGVQIGGHVEWFRESELEIVE
jgi:hypothetical protein